MARGRKTTTTKSEESETSNDNDSRTPSPTRSPSINNSNKKWRSIRFGRRNNAFSKVADEDPSADEDAPPPMTGSEEEDEDFVEGSSDVKKEDGLVESGEGSTAVDETNPFNNESASEVAESKTGSDQTGDIPNAQEADTESNAQNGSIDNNSNETATDAQTSEKRRLFPEMDEGSVGNDNDAPSTPAPQDQAKEERPVGRWWAARREATARLTSNILSTSSEVDRLADTGTRDSILDVIIDKAAAAPVAHRSNSGTISLGSSGEEQQPPQTPGMKRLVQLQNQVSALERKNEQLQSEIDSLKVSKDEDEALFKETVDRIKFEAEETAMKLSVLEQYFFELNKDEEAKRKIDQDAASVADSTGSMVTLDAAYVAELKSDVSRLREDADNYKSQLEELKKASENREASLNDQVDDLTQKLYCREETIGTLEASLTQLREGRFKRGGKQNRSNQRAKGEIEDDDNSANDVSTTVSSGDESSPGNAQNTSAVSGDAIAAAVDSALDKEREKHKRGVDSLKEKVRRKLRAKDAKIAKLEKRISELENEGEKSRSPSPTLDQFSLRTVKTTNEMMDNSIDKLAGILEKIKSADGEEADVLSAAEKISLVQIELQTSMKLLEQRMKNQLETQRDEAANIKCSTPRMANGTGQSSGEEVEEPEGETQPEKEEGDANDNAAQVESIEKRIQEVQNETMGEIRKVESSIQQKVTEVKDKTRELEIELENKSGNVRMLTKQLGEAKHSSPVEQSTASQKEVESQDEQRDNDSVESRRAQTVPESKDETDEENSFFEESGVFSTCKDDIEDDDSVSAWTNFDDNSVFTSKSGEKVMAKNNESAWKVENDVSFPSLEDDKELVVSTEKDKVSFPTIENNEEVDSLADDSSKSSGGGGAIPALPKMKSKPRIPLRATFRKPGRSQKAYSSMDDNGMIDDDIEAF